MALLSKISPTLSSSALMQISVRQSHAALFRKRPAQLIVNRIKDATHFYFVALGVLPVLACLAYNHIVYGNCELKDLPKEGPPPRYWQYERTPIRQWWAKNFGFSDVEHHERNLAFFTRQSIHGYWRNTERRVQHLEGERWDYKAWSYQPVSSAWVDNARWVAMQQKNQYEQYAHYPQ